MQKISWIAATLACAAWSAGSVAADTAAPSPTAAATPSTSEVAPAKRVVRDKKTGKLRAPSEDELQEMIAAENAARARQIKTRPSLIVRQYPNGMRSAVLGPEYLLTLKAQRRPDGSVEVSHDKHAPAHSAPNPNLPTE